VYHSTLGWRVIKKKQQQKKKSPLVKSPVLEGDGEGGVLLSILGR